MPEAPPASLLTWTTRGTRLHGDERGSVDRGHNRPGTPVAPGNAARAAHHARAVGTTGVTLDGASRGVVERAIEDHAAHRGWRVLGVAVRSNHIHVVVGAPERAPEEVVRQLKAWATRRLRDGGHFGRSPIWTRHASTRWLWDLDAVDAAVRYVMVEQDRPERYGRGLDGR